MANRKPKGRPMVKMSSPPMVGMIAQMPRKEDHQLGERILGAYTVTKMPAISILYCR